jgi:hypothetical protein
MALETNTLVNGAWTTQTLDVNDVLRHYNQQDKEANVKAFEVEKAPVLGLLTQTVIQSPLVHWILPVRLRDSFSNDVAFIGVSKLPLYLHSVYAGPPTLPLELGWPRDAFTIYDFPRLFCQSVGRAWKKKLRRP